MITKIMNIIGSILPLTSEMFLKLREATTRLFFCLIQKKLALLRYDTNHLLLEQYTLVKFELI